MDGASLHPWPTIANVTDPAVWGGTRLYRRDVPTSPGEGHFPTIVRSTTEWGIDPPLPFGVIEVWPVTIGDGPEQENRAVAIPLDPRLISELQQQLISAPTVALPWSVDDDSEQFDLATIDSEPVIVHRPPGLLTPDAEGVAYRIDGVVPSLTIEPNSFD
jgi:hypothetical protein